MNINKKGWMIGAAIGAAVVVTGLIGVQAAEKHVEHMVDVRLEERREGKERPEREDWKEGRENRSFLEGMSEADKQTFLDILGLKEADLESMSRQELREKLDSLSEVQEEKLDALKDKMEAEQHKERLLHQLERMDEETKKSVLDVLGKTEKELEGMDAQKLDDLLGQKEDQLESLFKGRNKEGGRFEEGRRNREDAQSNATV